MTKHPIIEIPYYVMKNIGYMEGCSCQERGDLFYNIKTGWGTLEDATVFCDYDEFKDKVFTKRIYFQDLIRSPNMNY